MSIESTLAERGERYGSFKEHAVIAQKLQDVMRDAEGWARLAPDQKQALTVIADKIARMLNGQPGYRDNWHDIVGYAKLVDDRMAGEEALTACVADPIPDVPDREYLIKHGYAPKPADIPAGVPPLHWATYPWATHFLNSKLGGVFAELVDGEYLGHPDDEGWNGRLKYHVGLGENDFKVSAVHPDYSGPLTREPKPPVLGLNQTPYPAKPEGRRWRCGANARGPRDMSEVVDAVMLNGTRKTAPASEFDWNADLSVSVAWWRFETADGKADV